MIELFCAGKITLEVRTHKGWEEYQAAKKKGIKIRLMFGKYQYIYSNEKGMISLVEFPNYNNDGVTWWEIYSLKGNLFDDVERFTSKEQAEEKIKKLLL